ncbi:hypothetical protein TNCV_89521 [Trichonephila clavipes]|nr:hypothetical protein TNCV_89521 [Trichonephila clavipes]
MRPTVVSEGTPNHGEHCHMLVYSTNVTRLDMSQYHHYTFKQQLSLGKEKHDSSDNTTLHHSVVYVALTWCYWKWNRLYCGVNNSVLNRRQVNRTPGQLPGPKVRDPPFPLSENNQPSSFRYFSSVLFSLGFSRPFKTSGVVQFSPLTLSHWWAQMSRSLILNSLEPIGA